MSKLISIVIPFHNRLNELQIALNSAINQTYKFKEIILINDCSTESIEKIKNICDRHKEVFLYSNKKREGASYSRNKGIMVSKGDFIAFLDSDDEWLSFKLETQIEYMLNKKLNFTYTDYLKRNLKNNITNIVITKRKYSMPFMAFRCLIATPTVVINKKIIDENIFCNEFEYGEDLICWALLSKKTPLKRLNKITTIVNVSRESCSASLYKQRKGFLNINNTLFKNSKLTKVIHRIYYELALIIKLIIKLIN